MRPEWTEDNTCSIICSEVSQDHLPSNKQGLGDFLVQGNGVNGAHGVECSP